MRRGCTVRLLPDTNISPDVASQRPGEAASSALIASCGQQNDAWPACHSVATLACVTGERRDLVTARDFLADLSTRTTVAATSHADAVKAPGWSMPAFEDALQVAAALACDAGCAITRNGSDFVGALLAVLSPEEFLLRDPAA